MWLCTFRLSANLPNSFIGDSIALRKCFRPLTLFLNHISKTGITIRALNKIIHMYTIVCIQFRRSTCHVDAHSFTLCKDIEWVAETNITKFALEWMKILVCNLGILSQSSLIIHRNVNLNYESNFSGDKRTTSWSMGTKDRGQDQETQTHTDPRTQKLIHLVKCLGISVWFDVECWSHYFIQSWFLIPYIVKTLKCHTIPSWF